MRIAVDSDRKPVAVSPIDAGTESDEDDTASSASESTDASLGDLDEHLFQQDMHDYQQELHLASHLHVCASCGEEWGLHHMSGPYDNVDSLLFAPLNGDIVITPHQSLYVCETCVHSLKNGKRPLHAVRVSAASPLFANMSRLDIEILRPCAPVVCLKSLPHGGSTGITGHSVIYNNNIQSVVAKLPRDPKDAAVLFAVRRSTTTGVTCTVEFHPELIRNALPQLILNHPAYAGVEIDEHMLANLHTSTHAATIVELSDSDSDSDDEEPMHDEPMHDEHHQKLQPTEKHQPTVVILSTDDMMAHAIDMSLRGTAENPIPYEEVRPRFPWEARLNDEEDYVTFYLRTFPQHFSDLFTVPPKLTELEFIRHLNRLPGGRFATDEVLQAVVYARLYRRRAAGICWKAAGGSDAKPTKAQLQLVRRIAAGDHNAITAEALRILHSLEPYCNSLPGSPPYMQAKRKDLLCWIASQQGLPFSLFVTLGNGLPFWPQPFQMLGADHTSMNRNEREALLRANPLTGVTHFRDRIRAFKRHVLNGRSKPIGVVKELFERLDNIQRGDFHLHLMVAVKQLGRRAQHRLATAEGRNLYAQQVERLVSATLHPVPPGFEMFGQQQLPGQTNEAPTTWTFNQRFRPSDSENPGRRLPPDALMSSAAGRAHLAGLQRGPETHWHWPPSCFRNKRATAGPQKCRTGAPWPLSTKPAHISFKTSGTQKLINVKLVVPRNHVWLAEHTEAFLFAHCGNVNTRCITDAAGCCRYATRVAAYTTRFNEPEESLLSSTLLRSIARLSPEASQARHLNAVLNAITGVQIVPIQEVLHTIMYGGNVHMTRKVTGLYIGRPQRQSVEPHLLRQADADESSFYLDKLLLRGYRDAVASLSGKDSRHVPWKTMCLATFAQTHGLRLCSQSAPAARKRPRVLNGRYAVTTLRRRSIVRTFPFITSDLTDENSAYAYLVLYRPHSSQQQLEDLIGMYGTAVAALAATWNELAPIGVAAYNRLLNRDEEQDIAVDSDEERDDATDETEQQLPPEPFYPDDDVVDDAMDIDMIAAAIQPTPAVSALPATSSSDGVQHVDKKSYNSLLNFVSVQAQQLRTARDQNTASMDGAGGDAFQTRELNKLETMVAELDTVQRTAYQWWTERTGPGSWPPTLLNHTLAVLMGGAGSGKTKLMQACAQFTRVQYGINEMGEHAPTGQQWKVVVITTLTNRAACNINGWTIHRTFKLFTWHIARRRTEAFRAQIRLQFKYTRAIMMDEIGNVPAAMLQEVSQLLKWAWHDDPVRSALSFAGIPLITVGDFKQLDPVGGSSLALPADDFLTNASPAACGHRLWQSFTHFTELTQNHRQQTDLPFYHMLERLREGLAPTPEDVALLNSRVALTLADARAHLKEDALMIATTWRNVDALNEEDLRYRIRQGAPAVNLHARHFPSHNSIRAHKSARVDEDDEPSAQVASHCDDSLLQVLERIALAKYDPSRVGGVAGAKRMHQTKRFAPKLPPHLCFAIGSRVRITLRIEGDDGADLGLVPGTFGYVHKFVYLNNNTLGDVMPGASLEQAVANTNQPALPIVILRVRSKDYNGADLYGATDVNGERPEWIYVPITPVECYIKPQNKNTYVRHQLPLELAQAMTVHSAQGDTADQVLFIVQPTKKDFSFADNLFYVGASRACTSHGLFILAPHKYTNDFWKDRFTMSRPHITRINCEYERLRALPGWQPAKVWNESDPFFVHPNDPMDYEESIHDPMEYEQRTPP